MTSHANDAIRDEIRRFLDELGVDGPFDDDEDLLDGGILHSLHAVELILFVSERFGVTLSPRDVFERRLASLRAIAELVAARAA